MTQPEAATVNWLSSIVLQKHATVFRLSLTTVVCPDDSDSHLQSFVNNPTTCSHRLFEQQVCLDHQSSEIVHIYSFGSAFSVQEEKHVVDSMF